ncbi:MAG TPA: hypothetical protein VLA89_01615 [Gemmatimonadales bacterium]|nr:hypothetical protein [Gemmatimonadales bacterium]
MSIECAGHVKASEESYGRLLNRYKGDSPAFVAELAKKNAERKLLHEMLTEHRVPNQTHDGRELCLLARVAILAARFEVAIAMLDELPVGIDDILNEMGLEWPDA